MAFYLQIILYKLILFRCLEHFHDMSQFHHWSIVSPFASVGHRSRENIISTFWALTKVQIVQLLWMNVTFGKLIQSRKISHPDASANLGLRPLFKYKKNSKMYFQYKIKFHFSAYLKYKKVWGTWTCGKIMVIYFIKKLKVWKNN